MATNKPKVLAYLPKQTYERLVLFQRERGLSLSQAVALVIEDYFGLGTEPLGESVSDRLTRLENAVANLSDVPINSLDNSQNALHSNLLYDSPGITDSLPVQPTPGATNVPPGKQQVNQLALSSSEWNVYLHHPRGTVEQIAGPFSDEEQAKSAMNTQMEFGLFPEFKGYKWECREDFQDQE